MTAGGLEFAVTAVVAVFVIFVTVLEMSGAVEDRAAAAAAAAAFFAFLVMFVVVAVDVACGTVCAACVVATGINNGGCLTPLTIGDRVGNSGGGGVTEATGAAGVVTGTTCCVATGAINVGAV